MMFVFDLVVAIYSKQQACMASKHVLIAPQVIIAECALIVSASPWLVPHVKSPVQKWLVRPCVRVWSCARARALEAARSGPVKHGYFMVKPWLGCIAVFQSMPNF